MTDIQKLTDAIERMNQLLETRDEDLNKWAKLCRSFADSSCGLIDIAYVPAGPGTWKERAESAETRLAKASEDALEKAAKVADTLAGLYRKEEREPSRSIGASQAAAAIRALIEKQP